MPSSSLDPGPASDSLILRTLWPVLLAAVIGLFPFTVYSTFVVPIAQDAQRDVALVGALRGLGGATALVVGAVLAPLIARWSAPHSTAASLALLSVTSLAATLGTLPALVVFCLGIGASTAILTPTLLTIATRTFARRGDAGRAATLVTATQSLAAVLAAPMIGLLGFWRGWHGALWVTAGAAALVALIFLRRRRAGAEPTATPLQYREALAGLRERRDLLALVGIAFLRTTAFMGYLALLAAQYFERFGLDPVSFTLVWTLSGASFFTGNYLTGRWARGPVTRRRLLLGTGLLGAGAAVLVVFTTDALALALLATVVMGFSHAVVAAVVTTMIAEGGGDLTTATFSITAAGMSLGVFTGAALAGAGLALGGGPGIAVALVIPTVLAGTLIPLVWNAPSASSEDGAVVHP